MSDALPMPDKQAMRVEVASLGTDPFRWAYGGRILTEDLILRTRAGGRGLWLYDDLAQDAQVASTLAKRRDALIGREWAVDPLAEDPLAVSAAELVQRALHGLAFNDICERALDAVLKGISILEVVWEVRGNELLPARLLHRDARRFIFRLPQTTDGMQHGAPELRLLSKGNFNFGDPVPDRKFLVHRHGGLYEDPWGLGVGNRLFWPVFFKRKGISFWLSALEKFGQPTVLGKYPAGTQAGQIDDLVSALRAVSQEAGVAIPDGMALELLEAKRAGTFDAYDQLCRYFDEQISLIVLGEILSSGTGQNGAGSRALGQVHNEVRLEITKADSERLSDTLNRLVEWIVDLNLPAYAASGLDYPKLAWDVSVPQDLAQVAVRDVNIQKLGYEPTEDYIRETYGEGWEKAAPPPPPPPMLPGATPAAPPGAPPEAPPTDLEALFAEAKAAIGAGTLPPADDPRDAADHLAEQLDSVAAGAQDAMIDAIRGVIDHAESLDQARRMIVRLLPTLPTAQLARLLGQAMTVAALQGRADVRDGD